MPPGISSFSPGRSASWPDTNTSPFALIACEYGAPWNGAGAASVRTTSLLNCRLLDLRWPASLPDRGPERLEDGAQHVLGILALEHPDVHVQPGACCKLVQEPAEDVAGNAAHPLVREIHVRGDQGPLRDLERGAGERLVGRHCCPAASPRAVRP